MMDDAPPELFPIRTQPFDPALFGTFDNLVTRIAKPLLKWSQHESSIVLSKDSGCPQSHVMGD